MKQLLAKHWEKGRIREERNSKQPLGQTLQIAYEEIGTDDRD